MKAKHISKILISLLCLLGFVDCTGGLRRENGWYQVIDSEKNVLSLAPIVTTEDFAYLRMDSDNCGNFVILGQISKRKQDRWADETEKAIGKRLAFVFNDSIISNPQVNQRIEGGNFQISVPKGSDVDLLSVYRRLKKEYRPCCYDMKDSAAYRKLEKALQEELGKPNVSGRASDYMKSDAYNAYKRYVCSNPEYFSLMFQGSLFGDIKGLHGYLIDDIVQAKYPLAPSIRTYVEKTNNMDDEDSAVHEWQEEIKF